MTLADWLASSGWTDLQLANAIGVSKESARLYRAALRRPGVRAYRINGKMFSRDVAAAITRVTNGAVTRTDLVRAYENRKKGILPHGKLDRGHHRRRQARDDRG